MVESVALLTLPAPEILEIGFLKNQELEVENDEWMNNDNNEWINSLLQANQGDPYLPSHPKY